MDTSDETKIIAPVVVVKHARARRVRIPGWIFVVLCWLPGITLMIWKVIQ